MQDPDYQSIYGNQSPSWSPVRRLLKRITLKAALLYGAAVFFFVGFFINDLPRASTTKDMFIVIVVFFASIVLLALLTLRDARRRERQAQVDINDSGRPRYFRRARLTGWLVGLLILSLAVALTMSNVYTSHPLVAQVVRSFAAGNAVFLMVSWANKAWRDEPESKSAPVPYRDHRGNYD